MRYTLLVAEQADKVLRKWKKSNPKLLQKCQQVFDDLAAHPREGIGHPEPLRGGGGITWSRRLSAHDRMVYDIHDEVVEVHVLSLEGHYQDK